MALQAFIDESFDEGGVFVLAGYIAPAEAWRQFSLEWEKLLRRFGRLDQDGRRYFHMAEMRGTLLPEGEKALFRVIEQHAAIAISCSIDQRDLRRVMDRLIFPVQPVDWGPWTNAYTVTFRALLDTLNSRRTEFLEVLGADEVIEYVFDERGEKAKIQRMWAEYVAKRPPELRFLFANAPRFENDKVCLPLQAADYWSWWIREWTAQGNPEKTDSDRMGDVVGTRRPFPKIVISFGLEQLMVAFKGLLKDEAPHLFYYDYDVE